MKGLNEQGEMKSTSGVQGTARLVFFSLLSASMPSGLCSV